MWVGPRLLTAFDQFRQVAGAVEGEIELVDDLDLFKMFGAALGLAPPWQVTSVKFDELLGAPNVGLNSRAGSRFACPHEGCANEACPVHDTMEKRWRHLDFFEHQAFLSARVPRVDCAEHGVHLVAVPWARPAAGSLSSWR